MSNKTNRQSPAWLTPVLCIVGLLITLGMLRLGVWQLDRAQQKQEMVSQLASRAELATVDVEELASTEDRLELRFRNTSLSGLYLADKTLFVDNQVVNGQVGYQVFTPFKLASNQTSVLISRGWVSVGESRDKLPDIRTNEALITLAGRLNLPPAEPPLWDPDYQVANGAVWQYLPVPEVAEQLGLDLFPLVVELAPDAVDHANLVRKWPDIDDQWVAKHQGYAFQWFAMAAAFFIACIVLLARRKMND